MSILSARPKRLLDFALHSPDQNFNDKGMNLLVTMLGLELQQKSTELTLVLSS
jgi:hypothetical protein